MPYRNCKICNKTFYFKYFKFKKANNIFYPLYCSKECRIKGISETMKKLFKEGKRKPINYFLGKKRSESFKMKIKIKNRISHLGKHHSNETKKKIGKAITGVNSPRWLGGISFEPYTLEFNKELKEFIRERNNWKCQLCGLEQNGRKLDIHHIDYGKKNTNFDNLVPLCRKCHIKTNYNRNWWIFYFANKVMKNA